MPQAIFLIDGPIAQNIALGVSADEIDAARLDWAARTALVLDGAFPAGLDTRVGDNGALLSGGQRQRIGIARALYRGGAVLFLDEATNALDAATEAAVLASLAALPDHPTLIVIAHRANVLDGCDHEIRVSGDGTALIQRVAGGGEGR